MNDQFKFRLPDGTEVRTGNIVPQTVPLSFQPYPETQMRDLAEVVEIIKNPKRIPARRKFAQYVDQLNQGGLGSCNTYMAHWMMSTIVFHQTGEWVRLSPEWMYMHINRGRDEGSLLDDGMVWGTDFGLPVYKQGLYEKYLKSQLSMELQRFSHDSAIDHRFGECYQAPKGKIEKCWETLVSCIAGGGAVGLAVHVGDKYMRSGVRAGYDRGMGNHAVAGTDLELLTPNPKSFADIAIVSPQSWGSKFADKGFTNLDYRHVQETMKYHALYCVRTVCATRDQVSKTKLN